MEVKIKDHAADHLLRMMQALKDAHARMSDPTTRLQIRGEMRGVRSAVVAVYGIDNPLYDEIKRLDDEP